MFGHPETVLIAFDDITALKDVQAQLEEAVRVRQDFLSIAGHELKTPLTSVMLNLHAVDKSLQGGARAVDDAPGRRAGRRSSRQLGRLEGLVDQLLDVSRITAGKMALAPEPIDLRRAGARGGGPLLAGGAAGARRGRHRRAGARRAIAGIVGSTSPRADPHEPAIQRRQIRRGAADLGRGRRGRPGRRRGGLDRRPRSRHRHVRGTSWAGSSGASNAPSPNATTAASGWASGSCARWSTPWAAASRSRASPTAGRRSRCGCRVARAAQPLTEPATRARRGSPFAMGRIFETRKATMFERWDRMAKTVHPDRRRTSPSR